MTETYALIPDVGTRPVMSKSSGGAAPAVGDRSNLNPTASSMREQISRVEQTLREFHAKCGHLANAIYVGLYMAYGLTPPAATPPTIIRFSRTPLGHARRRRDGSTMQCAVTAWFTYISEPPVILRA